MAPGRAAKGTGRSAELDAEKALFALRPPERHLACLCALLAGARAQDLVSGLSAACVEPVRAALRAFGLLDRPRKLKVFASALAATRGSREMRRDLEGERAPPPRLAAVLSLALSGKDRDAFAARHGAAAFVEDARSAHPALRAYAVRSRTAR